MTTLRITKAGGLVKLLNSKLITEQMVTDIKQMIEKNISISLDHIENSYLGIEIITASKSLKFSAVLTPKDDDTVKAVLELFKAYL